MNESNRSKWSDAPAPVGVVVEVFVEWDTVDAIWDGKEWHAVKTGERIYAVTHWARKA